ncbi:MAG: glycyl-radical enzyme activating protein [Pseudoramibacter sp.]
MSYYYNYQYEGKEKKGVVLRMERNSVYDGPGFRTVVFLKGCPLRCAWCSTPESQNFKIEKNIEGETYGSVMTVEQVLEEVRQDSAFYFHSGGGMTLSGGEMTAQPEFARCLLQEAQHEGIHTAIETSFFAKPEIIASLLPHVNLAFVDVKFISKDLHQKYCGVDNTVIKENLLRTNDMDLGTDFRLIVRTPVIPGLNDSDEELHKIGEFASHLKKLHGLQLLSYHKLGTDTYRKLGRPYLLEDVETPDTDQMEHYCDVVREHISNVGW